MLRKVGSVLFTVVTIVLVSTPLATYWRQKPTLAVTIRTWSMRPLFTRGDMVFIWPTGDKSILSAGQIIVFRSEDHGIRDWTIHRIVGGDSEQGFITKGDANEMSDQEGMGYPPVQMDWIAGVVPTIGTLPLKIPLLGYIPLLVEENMKNPHLLPMLLGVLALALLLDEVFKTKKKRTEDAMRKGQLYSLGGLAFAILMGALMLMSSLFIALPYGVEKSAGVLMGSDIGVLEIGDSRELVLAELTNKGFVPSYYCVISQDPQVVIHQDRFLLHRGDSAQVIATVYAQEEGMYKANIIVGMFMPFLPTSIISFLTGVSFWLALVVVSFVPAVLLFILPYLDPRHRHRIIREFRKKRARVLEYLKL
jgi:signal peptidase